MIRIIDDQIKRFIDFLNQNYGTEAECIVSVFNCQDSVCVSEDGKEEQSLFIPEADLVMLTTEKPANGIFDSAGNPAPKFYEDNYTLIKLAHEYGHFLQKYGKLPNPEDLEENEKVADSFAQKAVKEFLRWDAIKIDEQKSICQWQKEIHQNAIDHGWWDNPRTPGELLMLVVSEVSEAFEEVRNNHAMTETYYSEKGKMEGVPSELADVVIRVMDLAEYYGIDLEKTIAEKHAFNKTRPFKHGGKKL